MGMLSKHTIQQLALLRALNLWREGADGPMHLHRTLWAADAACKDKRWRLFGFKQGRLGPYSNEVASALNDLQSSGRIDTIYDGPSVRICAKLPPTMRRQIEGFFGAYFREWNKAMRRVCRNAALINDILALHARDDAAHKKKVHSEPVFSSFRPSEIEFEGLEDDVAEQLSDFVDATLHKALRQRVLLAAERPRQNEDWRGIYFDKVCETA